MKSEEFSAVQLSYIYNKVKGKVKGLLLVWLFTFLPFAIVRAQVGEYRTDFAVGASAGMTMSNISFVPEVTQKMLQGTTVGVTLRYTCEKYFKSICSLVAEVNYVQTGWRENILDIDDQPVYYADDASKTPLRYERKLNYLQIPLMARLGWGRERRGFQAFIQLGPQIGIFLNENTDTNIEDGRQTASVRSSVVVNQEKMPVENKFDYGIVGGAGLEFSARKVGHFIVEGRYYYGLGNIYGNTKRDFFARSNFGQIVVKATYLFDLVKTKNDRIK